MPTLKRVNHASYFFEDQDTILAFDPVFKECISQGIRFKPALKLVDPTYLKKVSAILISHHHCDHFDPESIKLFPRDVLIIVPYPDSLMKVGLEFLGFKNVKSIKPWQKIRIKNIEIVATPSLINIPEVGFYLKTDTISIWNQVDTIVDTKIIKKIRQVVGIPDIALSMFQPMDEYWPIYNQGVPRPFPKNFYRKLISDVLTLGAPIVIPSSCNWEYQFYPQLNTAQFQVSEKMFLNDVEILSQKKLKGLHLKAGHTLFLDSFKVKKNPQFKILKKQKHHYPSLKGARLKKATQFITHDLMKLLDSSLKADVSKLPWNYCIKNGGKPILNLGLYHDKKKWTWGPPHQKHYGQVTAELLSLVSLYWNPGSFFGHWMGGFISISTRKAKDPVTKFLMKDISHRSVFANIKKAMP